MLTRQISWKCEVVGFATAWHPLLHLKICKYSIILFIGQLYSAKELKHQILHILFYLKDKTRKRQRDFEDNDEDDAEIDESWTQLLKKK